MTAEPGAPTPAPDPLTGIEAVLAGLGDVVVATRTLAPRPPTPARWPRALGSRVEAAFAVSGIAAPWAHQAEALDALLGGADVVLASPTASGKSLAWMAPALQWLLDDPDATALYLAPSKALARDQHVALTPLAEALWPGASPAVAWPLDGDSPPAARSGARTSARILLTNPEMLHLVLLPSHPRWARFLGGLRLVVLDEAHQYRGLFGAHLANLLWRLGRVVAHHRRPGSAGAATASARRGPTFAVFAASATIANPGEHVARLTGRTPVVVASGASPRGPQRLVLGQPALLDPALGIRRTLREETVRAAALLGEAGLRTLVFVRTRQEAEETTAALREVAGSLQAARVYRSGLAASERRAVEKGLREGAAAVVVSTSALELGVDPGPVDACIIAGYPGTLASFRQQAGRTGRRERPSLVLWLAGPGGLDQYLLRHPELLTEGTLEHARCDPANPLVRLAHLGCAAYELPLAGATGDDVVLLEALAQRGEVRAEPAPDAGTSWRWMGAEAPAGRVSLRADGSRSIAIRLVDRGAEPTPVAGAEPTPVAGAEPTPVAGAAVAAAGPPASGRPRPARAPGRLLGTLDAQEAPARLHPGAVYLHDGRAFRVQSLDLETREARVTSEPGPGRTAVRQTWEVAWRATRQERPLPGGGIAHGLVSLGRQVDRYREWDPDTGALMAEVPLTLPAQTREVAACWITLGADLRGRLEHAGWWTPEAVRAGARGPGWAAQRRQVRVRDAHRCRHCGAPEPPGREHDVHHLQPFRTFGWLPGANQAHQEANRLENLVLLCPTCHHRAEAGVRSAGLLTRLAGVLGQVAPLLLMCDPRDLELIALGPEDALGWPDLGIEDEVAVGSEAGSGTGSTGGSAAGSGDGSRLGSTPGSRPGTITGSVSGSASGAVPVRLLLAERVQAGAGLAEAVYRLADAIFAEAERLIQTCPCGHGCPACAGPPDDRIGEPRVALGFLMGALLGRDASRRPPVPVDAGAPEALP